MPETAQQPLSARAAQRINDRVTREVFRLAGRDPNDHMECFKACLETIENTKVVEATDYAIWERQVSKFYLVLARNNRLIILRSL
jgi:hypothetical protein